MVKQPLSGVDRAQDHESGSVTRKKAQVPSLKSSYDGEYSDGDESSCSSISSARKHRVEKEFRAARGAPARDQDSERTMARSDARNIPADSCDQAASTDVIRLTARSKLPSRVRGVEQPIRAPSGARDRDRKSRRSRRRLRAPAIPLRNRTRQLFDVRANLSWINRRDHFGWFLMFRSVH